MARGKYLSLEEARKAGQLNQFTKEHPIEDVHPQARPRTTRRQPTGAPLVGGGPIWSHVWVNHVWKELHPVPLIPFYFNALLGIRRAVVPCVLSWRAISPGSPTSATRRP